VQRATGHAAGARSLAGAVAMIVAPESFHAAFLHAAGLHAARLQQDYNDSRSYTKLIREQVLGTIATRLGLHVYASDYYTLDAIFYAEADEVRFKRGTYAKRIAVAFEHENDSTRSYEEMNKLQLFSASLKVLVTYAKSGAEQQSLLRMYAEIIAEADLFDDIATLRRQLVIFGEAGPTAPTWSGYAWGRGGFERLPE
jgi:hypothetical protein